MKYGGLLAVLLMLGGCLDLAGEPSRDEVAYADAPDGRTRAVLLETDGGATTSFGYEVELRSAASGEEPVQAGELYGAIRSDCSYGINLRWLSPTTLVLEFMDAKRASVPANVRVGGKTVTMLTRTGVSDADAPCGGMLASRG